MGLKKYIKKLLYGHQVDSESYVAWLRAQGVSIGENTVFISPRNTVLDAGLPFMIKIGRNCTITAGVTMVAHDYGLRVLKGVYGDVLGRVGKVEIGDNVYIGMNTTIVAGAKIGNNVIIGANSLVSKEIPDNCVAAGNPAKVIRTLDEYYESRNIKAVEDAKTLAKAYYEAYHKIPPKEVFYEFFWLFANTEEELIPAWREMLKQTYGEPGLVMERFKNHQKVFASYEAFIEACELT